MKTSFELILLSSENDATGEIETITRLFNAGLKTFHVRKPHWGIEQTQLFLETIPKGFHNKIVLHSHIRLANKFQLKGIHLNETNKELIQELRNYKIISASFHSLQDLKENTFPYQYVFLSPIFDSISKAGYNAKFDLKLLAEELELIKRENPSLPKIIALGGIDAGNIMKTTELGFSGAALLGAVWQSENPVEMFLNIQSIISG